MDAAYYEERAIHHLKCGEARTAQVMATLAVVEQLKIMNDNTRKLYGAAINWNSDAK